MAVQISRREVLNNIIRFKDNLLERKPEDREKEKRSYPVLLNRKTGDIRFAQKIESIEHHFPRKGQNKGNAADWKEIQIDVSVKKGEVHFDLRDQAHHPIKPEGLEPIAFLVINETLEALNQIAHQHRSFRSEGLPEEQILKDLSDIHLSPSQTRIDDFPGWLGSVTRIDAEKMLQKRPHGTYLLRHVEELGRAMIFHLAEENRMVVKGYLCTIIEGKEKISDLLFIQIDRGWTIYQDDPNLSAHHYLYYPSLQTLLDEIRHRAKSPLR